MGGACSCKCCAHSRKHYVLLSDGVVLETDKERTSGTYYFHPHESVHKEEDGIQSAESTSDDESDDVFEVEPEHRFASLIRESTRHAFSIYPKLPEWRILFENKEQSFCAWERSGECRLATYRCEGVYAEELARSFWDPNDKNWDATIASLFVLASCCVWCLLLSTPTHTRTSQNTCKVLETLSPTAYVSHIVFKEVWPVSPRDCVACNALVDMGHGCWAVCIRSVHHEMKPESRGNKNIRMDCTVNFIARQRWKNPELGTFRDNSECYISYTAVIDLKGWIPDTVIKSFTIRQWPETLQNIHRRAL